MDAATSSAVGSTALLVVLIPLIIGLAVKIGLGFVVGKIAEKKGYGFAGFFLLGIFFFIIGLIVSLCLSDKNAQINNQNNAVNAPKVSESEELLRLKKLLDENVITQEEFEAKKKQLLGL